MSDGWQVTTVISTIRQSPSSVSLRLALGEPFTAIAGQHIDIRLTAEDGYTTARAYSLSDTRERATTEVTVERADDGEVSPYLVDVVEAGDPLEISGPHGGWFTWEPSSPRSVQLIGGGSGIVPLMSMIRAREASAPQVRFNLVYSLRSPDRTLFTDDLRQLADHHRLSLNLFHTRVAPAGESRPPGRLTSTELADATIAPDRRPDVYICGPNGFVENCAQWMIEAGHDRALIRTERFG
ncbi:MULTISPECIES: FAD-binding oxidoreductase [Gordonia]|uniref:FAD-binding oxidoreductase n=1 Tax=Gordonia TaxID=2053 RepID=UPI0032B4074D